MRAALMFTEMAVSAYQKDMTCACSILASWHM